MSRDKKLREAIAATLARYAPDAFSSIHGHFEPCAAEFPKHYSRREAASFRKLADKVLENVAARDRQRQG